MGCCQNLTGIVRGCDKGIGGIHRAWIACFDEVSKPTVTNDTITAITPSNVWYEYEFRKQTGNVVYQSTAGADGYISHWVSTVTLQFTKMEAVKRAEIMALSQSDLAIIIEDENGEYWYFGFDYGVILDPGTVGNSGTAFADFNGWDVVFTDTQKQHPYTVSPAAMADIIG